MTNHELMSDVETDTGTTDTRRERAVRFVDEYIDEPRDLFDKLARE